MRFVLISCLALFIAIPAFANDAGPSKAKQLFEQLKLLEGDWKSDSADGTTVVNYRLVAKGSTLVETWTMSPTRQSMTVYTMDGERLLATHYCPQGNAPRLKFSGVDASGANHFSFLDGANLQDPEGSHEHAFWIRLDSSDAMTRNETYIGNAAIFDASVDKGASESFTRLK